MTPRILLTLATMITSIAGLSTQSLAAPFPCATNDISKYVTGYPTSNNCSVTAPTYMRNSELTIRAEYDTTTSLCVLKYAHSSLEINRNIGRDIMPQEECRKRCVERNRSLRCDDFRVYASTAKEIEAIYDTAATFCKLRNIANGALIGSYTTSKEECVAHCAEQSIPSGQCSRVSVIDAPAIKVEATYDTLSTACILNGAGKDAGKIVGTYILSKQYTCKNDSKGRAISGDCPSICKQLCDFRNSPIKECSKFTLVTPPSIVVEALYDRGSRYCELKNQVTGKLVETATVSDAECRSRCDAHNSPVQTCAKYSYVSRVRAVFYTRGSFCELYDADTGAQLLASPQSQTACKAACDVRNTSKSCVKFDIVSN